MTLSSRVRSWMEKLPLFSSCSFEYANVSQILRMFHEHSAQDQSLTAWISVGLGLIGYYLYYTFIVPNAVWARRVTAFSIFLNLFVVATVIYFRFFQ